MPVSHFTVGIPRNVGDLEKRGIVNFLPITKRFLNPNQADFRPVEFLDIEKPIDNFWLISSTLLVEARRIAEQTFLDWGWQIKHSTSDSDRNLFFVRRTDDDPWETIVISKGST